MPAPEWLTQALDTVSVTEGDSTAKLATFIQLLGNEVVHGSGSSQPQAVFDAIQADLPDVQKALAGSGAAGSPSKPAGTGATGAAGSSSSRT